MWPDRLKFEIRQGTANALIYDKLALSAYTYLLHDEDSWLRRQAYAAPVATMY